MSAAYVALESRERLVLSHGAKPSPTYFPMAQIRPLASSCLFASGVVVAVRTSSPSA